MKNLQHTDTKDLKKEQSRILSLVLNEVRQFKNIEDDGYTYADGPYTEGEAYWYYSPTGNTHVTVMPRLKTPIYPEGDWIFAAMTLDGELEYDNTIVPAMMALGKEL